MAKDPAFLFYTGDFATGTQFFTDDQVGKYIRLLMAQHQHGHLSEKQMLHICKSYDNDIFIKFAKDDNGMFFNERLEDEILKRKKYSESRSNNKSGRKPNLNKDLPKEQIKSYDYHMENENENIIVNKDISSKEEIKGVDFFEPKEQTKKLEICKALMIEFGFVFGMQKDSDKQRSIWQALTDIEETKGLDYFIETYQAYKNYKKLAGEITHGFKGIINGGWDADNWQFKIDNFKHNGKSGKQGKDLTNLSNLTDAILADAGINLSGSNTQK